MRSSRGLIILSQCLFPKGATRRERRYAEFERSEKEN